MNLIAALTCHILDTHTMTPVVNYTPTLFVGFIIIIAFGGGHEETFQTAHIIRM